ncbi:hypothetical protein BGX31_005424 [Mortierella sp. GBA43]|nr:hypothetical protein BGX31_005424 [Mortierella sp. GBA43]
MTLQTFPLALLLLPFLVSHVASQSQGTLEQSSCIANYDPQTDYFSNKITVDNAALFKIQYEKNYKVLTTTMTDGTGNPIQHQYVLTQCGTPAPRAELFDSGAVFVWIPVTNAASTATTAVSFIEMLGRRSAIKAVDTEALVSSPCIQYDLEHNTVIGIEDKNQTLRAEQFQNIDVVFSTFGAEPGNQNKTVITAEVSDPGPLNRAEWLEFYSTFFNLEEYAQSLTASINNNYNCFKRTANTKPTRPIIAWTSYNAPSSFNNNTAYWIISNAEYKRTLTTDAGATFFNGSSTGSFTNSSAFREALKDVDVIIDETMVGGSDMTAFLQNYNLLADADLKFLKNKAVYRQDGLINPNDGRDWFSGAVVMNDAVLQDIIRTAHPDALPAQVHYNWIRNIAKNEPQQILSSANCTATDSSKPIPDRALDCATMRTDDLSDDKNSGSAGFKEATSALMGIMAIMTTVLVL